MLLIKDMKTIFPAHDMLIYVGPISDCWSNKGN